MEDLTEDEINTLTEEPAADVAMMNIFTSCDTDNIGSVYVSKLITFITPFMKNNLSDLIELQKALDPDNKDPLIKSDVFYKVMSEWTLRFSKEVSDNSFSNTTIRDSLASNELFTRSTSCSGFNQNYNDDTSDSPLLNLSETFFYSIQMNASAGDVDKMYLEEKINKLVHQNYKLNEEMHQIKDQMTHIEDEKDNLIVDYERVCRRLQSEQQINEQLQKDKLEVEEFKELLSCSTIKADELRKLLIVNEKENTQLNIKLQQIENEKQILEKKIENFENKFSNMQKIISELQNENDSFQQKISEMEKINENILEKYVEQQRLGEYYIDEIQKLKDEKEQAIIINQELRENVLILENSVEDYDEAFSPNDRDLNDTSFATINDNYSYESDKNRQIFYTSTPKHVKKIYSIETPSRNLNTNNNQTFILNKTYNKENVNEGIVNKFTTNKIFVCCTDSCSVTTNGKSFPAFTTAEEDNSYVIQEQSSEDCFNLSKLIIKHSPKQSLKSEISQAENNQDSSITQLEFNEQNRSASRCGHDQEINKLQCDHINYRQTITNLTQEIEGLKSELSLNKDRETVLLEINSELEAKLSGSKINLSEIKLKLMNFEEVASKCVILQSENNDLKKENAEKYIKIVDLCEEIENLRTKLRKTYEEYTEDGEKCSTSINNLQQENDALKTEETKNLQQQIHELNTEKIKMQEFTENLLDECRSLKFELENKNVEIEDLEKKLNNEQEQLNSHISKIKKDYEEQSEKTKKLYENQIIKLETRMEELLQEVKFERLKVIDLTNAVIKYEDVNRLMETELETIKEENKDLKDKNNHLIQQFREIEANMKSEISSKTEEIELLLDKLNEKDNEIRDILEYKKKLKISEDDKETLNNKYINLKKENDYLCSQLEDAKKQTKFFEALYKNSSEEMNCLKEAKNALQDYNNNIKQECENLLEQLKSTEKEKGDTEKYLSDECNKLKFKLKEKDELMKELEGNLVSAKNSVEDLQEKNEIYGQELHTIYQDEISAAYKKIESLESIKQKHTSEIENIKQNYDELNNKFIKLSKEKELWIAEKTNWKQIKEEFSDKIACAMYETAYLQQEIMEEGCQSDNVQQFLSNCSKCEILIKEIYKLKSCNDELTRKVEETDDDKTSKKGSFYKMQIYIEKLQLKIDNLEQQLENEADKSKSLENKYSDYSLYIENIIKEKNDLEEKLKITQENKSSVEDIGIMTDVEYSENTARQLQNYLEELNNTKLTLKENNAKMFLLLQHLENTKQKLAEKRKHLEKSILNLKNSWHLISEQNSNLLDHGEPIKQLNEFNGPLDEEMFKLQQQVDVTIQLLEFVCNIKTTSSKTSISLNEMPLKSKQSSLNKFSLKTTVGFVRFDAPGNEEREDNCKINTINLCSDHGDHDGIASINSFTVINKEEYDIESIIKDLENVLENHGKENGKIIRDEEFEENFQKLLSSFTSIQKQYKQRSIEFKGMENNLTKEVEKLITIFNQIKTNYPLLLEPISIALSQTDTILKLFTNISVGAEQLGSLQQENRLLKLINLMVNYITLIKNESKESSPKNTKTNSKYTLSVVTTNTNFADQSQSKTDYRSRNRNWLSKLFTFKNAFVLFIGILVTYKLYYLTDCCFSDPLSQNYITIRWPSWEDIFSPLFRHVKNGHHPY